MPGKSKNSGSSNVKSQLDEICKRFLGAWAAGHLPRIDDYLCQCPVDSDQVRRSLAIRLVVIDLDYRWVESASRHDTDTGHDTTVSLAKKEPNGVPDTPDLAQYVARYPILGLLSRLPEEVISAEYRAQIRVGIKRSRQEFVERFTSRSVEISNLVSEIDQNTPEMPVQNSGPTRPTRIGRYEILEFLGEGGFGSVYLAFDHDLDRMVAIKQSRLRAERLSANKNLIKEARSAARLRHGNIVSVYDVGREEDSVFIVMEYVEGRSLRAAMDEHSLSHDEVISLVCRIGDAIHYAHTQGCVHRDLKPPNILLDSDRNPRVADFGLALREEDQANHVGEISGTPYYMAPEQVRGESHRLDGRTDIWSLGVVLYELLTGRRPFTGKQRATVFDEILYRDPRPLRQVNDRIPRPLELICLKCLSKRMTDRYSTAADLVEELRSWQAGNWSDESLERVDQPYVKISADKEASNKVIPKGLRSFDSHDAGFYLQLLPGPTDSRGVPECIRFWKTRIEAVEPNEAFSVGVLYGPSGCGKSSIVRAGILPLITDRIVTVYVEATPEESESALLRELVYRRPALAGAENLRDAIARLRENGDSDSEKTLIVIDQFEQWLHGHRRDDRSELVQALRQCDGTHVQCLLLVRDDFWMAITSFMQQIEVPLVHGHNFAAADLFDELHARDVLIRFGQAYSRIPNDIEALTAEHEQFLSDAISGLAFDGRIIPIRLSVFAEMLKDKPWTAETLKRLGGADGVGVKFLDDAFCTAAAPPTHRRHERAARQVLESLLPEAGTDIKAQTRNSSELLEISGYVNRPADFHELLRILDSEVRLLTPADSEITENDTGEPARTAESFQLTHDFLVPTIREWLTRRRRETKRGRATICLEDCTRLWSKSRSRRHLPSFFEFVRIASLTSRSRRNESQRAMMRAASVTYLVRGIIVSMVAVLLGILIYGAIPRPTPEQFFDRGNSTVVRVRALQSMDMGDHFDVVCNFLHDEGDSDVVHSAVDILGAHIQASVDRMTQNEPSPVLDSMIESTTSLFIRWIESRDQWPDPVGDRIKHRVFHALALTHDQKQLLKLIDREFDQFSGPQTRSSVLEYIASIDLQESDRDSVLEELAALGDLLERDDPQLRTVCLSHLGKLSADTCVDLLTQLHSFSGSRTSCRQIITALAASESSQAVAVESEVFKRLNTMVNEGENTTASEPAFLVEAVGRFGNTDRLPALWRMLQDREEVAQRLGVTTFVEPLIGCIAQLETGAGELSVLIEIVDDRESRQDIKIAALRAIGAIARRLDSTTAEETAVWCASIIHGENVPIEILKAAIDAYGYLGMIDTVDQLFPYMLNPVTNYNAAVSIQRIAAASPDRAGFIVRPYLEWYVGIRRDGLDSLIVRPASIFNTSTEEFILATEVQRQIRASLEYERDKHATMAVRNAAVELLENMAR